MDGADVGMIQSGSGLRFSLEPRQGLRVSGHVIRQELQSDETVKTGVLSLIHNTHAATAQSLEDAVMRKGDFNKRPRCVKFVSESPKTATSKIRGFKLCQGSAAA